MAEFCTAERNAYKEAGQDWIKAADQAVDAAEDFLSETSMLDESTWATLAAILGTGLACYAGGPPAWLICGGALVGGGVTVGISEADRFEEIGNAEERLEALLEDRNSKEERFYNRVDEYNECVAHYIAKVLRDNP